MRALAASAAQLIVIMTLGPWESAPLVHRPHGPTGPIKLVDSESGAELSAELSRDTLERYTKRLARLQDGLGRACAQVDALLLRVCCDVSLADALRRDLLPAGVVSPA